MNFYAVSALVNVVTSIVLGFLVLFSNYRSRVNQIFFLFATSIALWGYAYFFWQIASDPNTALYWVRVLMTGAILIPFFYFHFVARFLGEQRRLRLAIWGGYAAALVFSFANWGDSFVATVESRAGFSFWPSAGSWFLPFIIIWVFYAAYAVKLLFDRFQTSDRLGRARIQYILIGTAVGYLGGLTNYFLWFNIPILPYGNITASFYIIFVAYAILRHGLFNMKVVATDFIVFALWLFVFIRMLVANNATEQFVSGGLLLVLLAVGVLLIRSVEREVEQREKLEKLTEELKETNARQENLIHFIGHEVKGFLTKAQSTFSILVDGDLGTLPESAQPFIAQALQDTRDGVASVSDILKAANLKRGTVTFKREAFDLQATVADAVERARTLAKGKGLELSFSPGEGDFTMQGDAGELRDHVFRNLVENAIYYTPKGSIEVSLEKRDGKNICTVHDSGVGITEEDKQKLFTEGGHGKDSITINANSSGYGLFIAKQVVEAHGGTISAASEGTGKGSTFTVELPA